MNSDGLKDKEGTRTKAEEKGRGWNMKNQAFFFFCFLLFCSFALLLDGVKGKWRESFFFQCSTRFERHVLVTWDKEYFDNNFDQLFENLAPHIHTRKNPTHTFPASLFFSSPISTWTNLWIFVR